MPSDKLVRVFFTTALIAATICIAGALTGPVLRWHYVPMVLGYSAVICIVALVVIGFMLIWS